MKSLVLAAAVAAGLFATTQNADAQRRGRVYYSTPTYSTPVYSYPSSGGIVLSSGYAPSGGTVITTGGSYYSYPNSSYPSYYNSGYYNGGYYNGGFYNAPVYYSSPALTVTGNGVYWGGGRRGWRW